MFGKVSIILKSRVYIVLCNIFLLIDGEDFFCIICCVIIEDVFIKINFWEFFLYCYLICIWCIIIMCDIFGNFKVIVYFIIFLIYIVVVIVVYGRYGNIVGVGNVGVVCFLGGDEGCCIFDFGWSLCR